MAVMVGVLVLVVGAAVAASRGLSGNDEGTLTGTAGPPATARVARQTIQDTEEVQGDLAYVGAAVLWGHVPGVVTRLPMPGDLIQRGRPVYRVDDRPVVLLYGDVPAYRSLGPGAVGPDVRQLEENLAALGYRGFTVDSRYTAETARAVRRWRSDVGLADSGRVELGRVVFAPGRIRIDAVTTGLGQSTGDGEEVLRYTGTGRQVVALLEVARQRLARPAIAVRVRMPDGSVEPGRVSRVSSVVDTQDPGTTPQTRIQVTVTLERPGAASRLQAAVVSVVFTAAEHRNVLTVPVAALVALAGGGYGLEIVDTSATHYVRVDTGLFADGRVEVSGAGLVEGAIVGMPR